MPASGFLLQCHPATPCPILRGISVAVARDGDGALVLSFEAQGDLTAVQLPALLAPGPGDRLWERTCFEAFVALDGECYREFNFSPSGQWAIYDFSGYRISSPAPSARTSPTVSLDHSASQLTLVARIPPNLLPRDAPALGLSAVVETVGHGKSYWALAHAPGNPDFHRRENFLATLPRV